MMSFPVYFVIGLLFVAFVFLGYNGKRRYVRFYKIKQ
jgi:hypothetical protein